MKVDTYKCDICGIEKKDANHWWKAAEVTQDGKPAGIIISQWKTRFYVPTIPEMQAYRNFFDAGRESHFCGENHVFQWVSEKLTMQKVGK